VERGGGRGGEKDIVCKVRVRVVTCIPLAAVFLGGCAPSILLKSLHGSHLSETSMPMVQDSFMFDMRKISFSPARQFCGGRRRGKEAVVSAERGRRGGTGLVRFTLTIRKDFPCLALPKMLMMLQGFLATGANTPCTSST
jgi:hypothetical protein